METREGFGIREKSIWAWTMLRVIFKISINLHVKNIDPSREREVPRSPFCARISPFGFWIMREREGMDLRYWVSDTIRVHEELTRTDEFVY